MFELIVNFGGTSLDQINADALNLVVTKKSPGAAKVSWVVIPAKRLKEKNTITWDEGTFMLFASSSELQSGAQIQMQSSIVATPGYAYQFANGHFNPSSAVGVAPNSFNVRNASTARELFGVAQAPSVNGLAQAPTPFFQRHIMPGLVANLTPEQQLTVYLHDDIELPGVIHYIAESTVYESLPYGTLSTQSISYNQQAGLFVFGSAS